MTSDREALAALASEERKTGHGSSWEMAFYDMKRQRDEARERERQLESVIEEVINDVPDCGPKAKYKLFKALQGAAEPQEPTDANAGSCCSDGRTD